jgi:hypothetical protein
VVGNLETKVQVGRGLNMHAHLVLEARWRSFAVNLAERGVIKLSLNFFSESHPHYLSSHLSKA